MPKLKARIFKMLKTCLTIWVGIFGTYPCNKMPFYKSRFSQILQNVAFWSIVIGFLTHFSSLTPVSNRCVVYRRLTSMTLTDSFNFLSQFSQWPQTVSARFQYSIYPITFSVGNADEWKKLFKPCAAQRLFLPVGSRRCLMFSLHLFVLSTSPHQL